MTLRHVHSRSVPLRALPSDLFLQLGFLSQRTVNFFMALDGVCQIALDKAEASRAGARQAAGGCPYFLSVFCAVDAGPAELRADPTVPRPAGVHLVLLPTGGTALPREADVTGSNGALTCGPGYLSFHPCSFSTPRLLNDSSVLLPTPHIEPRAISIASAPSREPEAEGFSSFPWLPCDVQPVEAQAWTIKLAPNCFPNYSPRSS